MSIHLLFFLFIFNNCCYCLFLIFIIHRFLFLFLLKIWTELTLINDTPNINVRYTIKFQRTVFTTGVNVLPVNLVLRIIYIVNWKLREKKYETKQLSGRTNARERHGREFTRSVGFPTAWPPCRQRRKLNTYFQHNMGNMGKLTYQAAMNYFISLDYIFLILQVAMTTD